MCKISYLKSNDIPNISKLVYGIEGKILKLRTKKRNDFFIISNRYSDNESITDNGIHYGVEVLGLVFDNHSRQGLPRDEWINDFSCRSGEFYLEELDNF